MSELDDRNLEINQTEENKEERMKKMWRSLHDLCNTIKRINIKIMGVPKRDWREMRAESLFKKIKYENFPNLGMFIFEVLEANRSLHYSTPKWSFPKHIIIQLLKIKKLRILKAARKKKKKIVTYKGMHIRLLADFSAENLQTRTEWNGYPKCWKKKMPVKNTPSSNFILEIWKRNRDLPRQTKTEGAYHH